MEFINASVPLIAWPHFGDQHTLAELFESNGAGIVLYNKMRFTSDEDRTYSYVDEVFTA